MSRGDERDEAITVHVPAELPELTPQTCRALLAMLVELTDIEAPGGAARGERRD
ncbi:hypothetical protein [Saccharopolyspora sp. SCSIO 74807]|uniref:hypothetical protein n=1 Tax=Saccharopolyspora sp. SCSIO 74807 TaxID=3118084 RepID=UPI0030CD247C